MAYKKYGIYGYECSKCGKFVDYSDKFCRECGDKLKPATKYEQFREVMADQTPSQIAELCHLLAVFGRDYQRYLSAPYPKENQHDFILNWLKGGD